MPLIDRQKLVVDLRTNVKAGEKFYEKAQQLISTATSMRDWKEPTLIEVRNIAGHDVTIDKTTIKENEIGKLYDWQYVAALRFFEATDENAHKAAIEKHVRKPVTGESPSPASTSLTADDVAKIVVKTLNDMGIKGA